MLASLKTAAKTVGFFGLQGTVYFPFMTAEMRQQAARLEQKHPGGVITTAYRYVPGGLGDFDVTSQEPTTTIRPK